MGYLGRRIGLSQDSGDSNPSGADGAVGGGILDLFASGYFERQDKIYNAPGISPGGLSATGGIINDYTVSSDVYRAHIFTSSGTFVVSRLAGGGFPDNLEYLVVAGGGGGGGESSQSGGGGAGGFRTNLTGHPVKAADYTAEVGTYTVTVGAGGQGGLGPTTPGGKAGSQGGNSEFFPTPVSYPSTKRVRAVGGGGGMGYTSSPDPVMNGGSGGGAVCSPSPYSGGTGNTTDPNHPQVQGYAGGDCTPSYSSPFAGGGGGGAGRVGAPDNPSTPLTRSTGGYGLQCLIAGPPANPQPIGAPGPGSGAAATGYFAGGGGGGSYGSTGAAGGYGGGADGGGTNIPSKNGPHAAASTGGGGGGSGYVGSYGHGGNGGSGVVVVRYKIASVSTAKATGGAISFYNGKTIHTFTSSGTFATTSDWSAATVEYVVIGGGGAGGGNVQGGGGGAGAYRTGTTPIGAHPVATTIQVGGGAVSNPSPVISSTGTPSYFGTPITAPGGGSGGNYPALAAVSGGSGGGGWGAGPGGAPNAGATGTGDPFPGTIGATPVNGWGNDGGQGGTYAEPGYGPAGGGGAGGAGSDGNPADTTAGRGGAGIQLPATFRNPESTVGAPGPTSAPTPDGFDTSGKYWVAGGGGGTGYNPPGTAAGVDGAPGGAAPGNSSPFAGGGGGAGDNTGLGGSLGSPGTVNTGGGGGGGERTENPSGGQGGSGIVIIAYPT